MKKSILVSGILAIIAIVMIAIAMTLQINKDYGKIDSNAMVALNHINKKSMASANRLVDTSEEKELEEKVEAVEMEITQQSIEPPPPRVEVYDHLTIEELSDKLNRNLKSTLAGQGALIATYSLQLGVDPYIAVAIMLHETGCNNGTCSKLVNSCNNVGGQKGAPGCGGGSYKSFPTLEAGIIGFLDNLYKNYYGYGLTTVEAIAVKYAESPTWPAKINAYVEKIRAS